ncbi:hypothetical protein VNI00_003131 [Paramarasmius palmivorus]|uniref:DUF3074 domain-containing protein n=1 Tax=Paramarasmius palmivorus TaxID=297713 RepID=A0AAW0DT89_9AGAR
MSSESFKLTITPPLKISDIPSEETIFAAADELINSTSSWKADKTYHKSSKPSLEGSKQVMEHLGTVAYISDIQKVTQVKKISSTQEIWTLHYKFPPPLSSRVFTVLQVTRLKETNRERHLSGDQDLQKLEEKGVKGRYVSVERLLELENGNTEWRMATSSTPVALFLTSLSNRDVPHFLDWLHKSK